MLKKRSLPLAAPADADEDLKKWSSQIRKGSLEMCLLGVIAIEPRYGFDIVQSLNVAGGLMITEGTLYPLLNRLSNEGLIEASWQESPSGPPRKYYALTPAGKQTFSRMRSEWRRHSQAIEAILLASEAGASAANPS